MIDYSKFLRNYSLEIQVLGGATLTVEPPFTVEFDITRNTWSSSNVASIRVFNLSQQNRNQIRKNVIDIGDLRTIKLKAGYGETLAEVFYGNITQAWSVREGNNFITQMESFDGGFAFTNGFTSEAFGANTQQTDVIKSLVKNMPGVTLGAIGDSFSGDVGARGISLSGPSCNLASEFANGNFFIDNSKAFFLSETECRQGQIALINASAGLLGTPLREQNLITFDMVFEPRVVVGQIIQLESSTDQNFNGSFKVVAIQHRGMISPAVCGDAVTSLRLDNSAGSLQVVTTQ
jgi:hypothetical protein